MAYRISEIRMVFDEDRTRCAVHIEPTTPEGEIVKGWHKREFKPDVPATQIIASLTTTNDPAKWPKSGE